MTAEFDRLLDRLAGWGITRVADTTGLDRVGVPTASAVKPGTRDTIWVYSGKGLTQDDARLVAVMECLERTAALWPATARLVWATGSALQEDHWGPDRFTERKTLRGESGMAWISGSRYPCGTPVWLPAHLVFNGRPPADAGPGPFVATTSNGLGAHVDPDAALLHALLEVVERHIISVVELTASHDAFVRMAGLARQLGLRADLLEGYVDDPDAAVTIDHETLPGDARALVERFRAAGLDVIVKRIPNSLDIPTFGVAAVESTGIDEYLACAGYAARLSSRAAVTAALLELAQTRATDLQGAREDRHHVEKTRVTVKPHAHWLASPGAPEPFEPAEPSPGTPAGGIAYVDAALARAGFEEWAYVWFPTYEGIACCRVVIPGVETWHPTAGESGVGVEVARRLGIPA